MSSAASLVGRPLVSRLGRSYVRTARLRSNPTAPERSVYLAEWQNQKYVLKRVSQSTYQKCQALNKLFSGSSRLRLHIDDSEEENTLVYEHFRGTFLSFMREKKGDESPASMVARKEVVWQTGLALRELHEKGWMHVDLKPDNILLDWEDEGGSGPRVKKVVVSDLDSALELKGAWCVRPHEEFKHVRFGNVRWRAPEMQTGQGIGLFSDVFAYALIYIYALIDQVPLGENDYDAIAKGQDTTPEDLVLAVTMEFFGLPPAEFLAHIGDAGWQKRLKELAAQVLEAVGESHENQFDNWTLQDFPHINRETKELLSGMLRWDPKRRLTIQEVLRDRSWGERIERV